MPDPNQEFEDGFAEEQGQGLDMQEPLEGELVDDEPAGDEESTPAAYLRDLTEDEVYNRLSRVQELPDHLNALESRFTGNLGQFSSRLEGLEKTLSTRTSFDGDKLKSVLEAYDPQLAEVLIPALMEAFQTTPLDENTLRPHLEPLQKGVQDWMGEQLVMSAYPPETLGEIIPPVKDGKFAPEGQRHKDFIDWYSQQGYQTQQALLSFGAPYVNALRKFEQWEQSRNTERTQTAKGKSARLAGGTVPAGQSRRSQGAAGQSPQDLFLAAFEEASSEVGR